MLGGMAPLYFHIVNVCLHCVVTCLLMHTCERCIFEDSRLAFVTALLFAVHPVHTEAVSTRPTPTSTPLDMFLIFLDPNNVSQPTAM